MSKIFFAKFFSPKVSQLIKFSSHYLEYSRTRRNCNMTPQVVSHVKNIIRKIFFSKSYPGDQVFFSLSWLLKKMIKLLFDPLGGVTCQKYYSQNFSLQKFPGWVSFHAVIRIIEENEEIVIWHHRWCHMSKISMTKKFLVKFYPLGKFCRYLHVLLKRKRLFPV